MVISAGSWGENEKYRGRGRNWNGNLTEGSNNDHDGNHRNGGSWYSPSRSTREESFIHHTGTDAGTSTAGSFKTAKGNRSRYYASCPPSIVSTGSCAHSMDHSCNDSASRPQMDNDNGWDGFLSLARGRPSAESIFSNAGSWKSVEVRCRNRRQEADRADGRGAVRRGGVDDGGWGYPSAASGDDSGDATGTLMSAGSWGTPENPNGGW